LVLSRIAADSLANSVIKKPGYITELTRSFFLSFIREGHDLRIAVSQSKVVSEIMTLRPKDAGDMVDRRRAPFPKKIFGSLKK
jgi:hypothetical protein